jgi:peroxin-6
MLKAVTRQASLIDSKLAALNQTLLSSKPPKPKASTAYYFDHYATKEDVAVMVTEEDFIGAEKELVPSVSEGELMHYQKVRGMFEKVEEKKDDVNGSRKGKMKEKEKVADRKGKGKEAAKWDGQDGESEGNAWANGHNGNDKGKGKAKEVDMGFQESADDDEGLY